MSKIHSTASKHGLSADEIFEVLERVVNELPSSLKRVLVIHPDYSRRDFSGLLFPKLYELLVKRGVECIDALNAAGTHRPMSEQEVKAKLGIERGDYPLIGTLHNHAFADPQQLVQVAELDADFVALQTAGHLKAPLPVTVNRLLFQYDAVITMSGTVPHEATGFSGGTKILFPGIAGGEVIGGFHWAAVLIGIPKIIGQLENPGRAVVNEAAAKLFEHASDTPIVSLNMVYTEDEQHQVTANGMFAGIGKEGFAAALREAAELSAELHVVYLDEAKAKVVQHLPEAYDEVWTGGKGSYKLQREGVLQPDAEIILFAPHIDCFHSNPIMDAAIRAIGYHGRDYVLDYCRKNPGFDLNVASHVINVRGHGELNNGQEEFPFRVTLATRIPEEECRKVGLGYRDPNSLRKEDFQGPGKLWIEQGGQWLYARR